MHRVVVEAPWEGLVRDLRSPLQLQLLELVPLLTLPNCGGVDLCPRRDLCAADAGPHASAHAADASTHAGSNVWAHAADGSSYSRSADAGSARPALPRLARPRLPALLPLRYFSG